MAAKSVKNKSKSNVVEQKGMSKTGAVKIASSGKASSRKGGEKGGRKSAKSR